MTLEDKLSVSRAVTRCARWPLAAQKLAALRMKRGHREHGDDVSGITPAYEALEETCDQGNFAAFAHDRGEWCWEWAIATLLAGLQARCYIRILRREAALAAASRRSLQQAWQRVPDELLRQGWVGLAAYAAQAHVIDVTPTTVIVQFPPDAVVQHRLFSTTFRSTIEQALHCLLGRPVSVECQLEVAP